jgi:hypothetical protein
MAGSPDQGYAGTFIASDIEMLWPLMYPVVHIAVSDHCIETCALLTLK